MPLSTHLPLVEKVLGLQLLAANASLSTTSRLLSVSETTARQLRRTISAAAAAGRRPGQAVREAFAAGFGADDEDSWQAFRRVAAERLLERVAELPAGRGRPADLGEIVDAVMAEVA
jgi:hypothetical protein